MPDAHAGPGKFRCIVCEKYIDRADVLFSHKAEQYDGEMCICEDCMPAWQEKVNEPAQELFKPSEHRESFIAHCMHHFHDRQVERKHDKEIERAENMLVTFIHAAREDASMAAKLHAITGLDAFHRESLLNSIIAELEQKDAPEELLLVLHHLKDEGVAEKIAELLQKDID